MTRLQVEIPPACFIQDTPDDPPPTPSRWFLTGAIVAVLLYLASR